MEIPLLKDIVIIFGLAIVVLLICDRLRVSAIVGFFITGVLAGPYGFGLISAPEEVEILAEIGIVLLLFSIGIEFSLQNLLRIKRIVLLGGALQVVLTVICAFALSRQFGLNIGQSVFIGCLVSLSSTAIVLRLLQQRAEVETPYGQAAVGILIFQDIAVVPMMLMTPILAGTTGHPQESVTLLAIKGIVFIFLAFVSAKWVVPRLLYIIARTRNRELFMLSILVICFAVAFLTHSIGLSLALGAFLAGLIISETEFSHETLGNVIPFRDVFTSLFFVSIGMLLDVKFLFYHAAQIVLISASVMTLKSILVCAVVLLLGFPIRTGVLAAIALCQMGEFSFILFLKGSELGLLESRFYQLFLDVSVLTMFVTPFAITFAPKIGDLAARLPLPGKFKKGLYGGLAVIDARLRKKLRDHLIIVGFGFNGRNVAHVAKAASLPYVVLEMNPQTVKEERKKGESIYYGDASQEAVLEQADIKGAKVVVIAIPDPVASRTITATARRENTQAYIIVRTRYVSEMNQLYDLGADEVIPEEFETSIEIFSRVLAKYLIPTDEVLKLTNEARANGYKMFRTSSKESVSLSDLDFQLPELDISTFRVAEMAPAVGQTIAQIELRKKHGITLVAIQRDHQAIVNPGADTIIQAHDILVVVGLRTNLAAYCGLFMDPSLQTPGASCEIPGLSTNGPSSKDA